LKFSAALALLLSCLAWAPRIAAAEELVVENAWARKAPGSDVAAVYFVLRNAGSEPRVVTGVESPSAAHAMIHETSVADGQSRMRARDSVSIAAGETVAFEPGGLHVMLHGLRTEIQVGQHVPLSLLLADGSRIEVSAIVRPLSAQ